MDTVKSSGGQIRFSLPHIRRGSSVPLLEPAKCKLTLGQLLKKSSPNSGSQARLRAWKSNRPSQVYGSPLKTALLPSPWPNDIDSPRPLLAASAYFKTAIGSVNGVRKSHNQDSYFDQTVNSECRVLGLCDGHGAKGHLVSRLVADELPGLVFRKLDQMDRYSLSAAIVSSYDECSELVKTSKNDFRASGCACISLVFTSSYILCANLGHTQALIGRFLNGVWSVYQLSREHRPDQDSELRRILSQGGEVAISKRLHTGPARVYIKGTQFPGLCISRAMGDTLVEPIGVLPEPEITYFQPSPMDKFLLLATYGLWEVISSVEAVRMTAKHLKLSPQNAPGALVLEAQRRWKGRGGLVDDITVMLVVLDQ